MDLNERETLVKVEAELKNVIDVMGTFGEDVRDIFKRIEHDSKAIEVIKGDLKTHFETSEVKRDSCDNRMKQLKTDADKAVGRLERVDKDYKSEIESLKKVIINIEKKQIEFITQIETSSKNTKLFFGLLFSALTLITPFLTLLIKEVLLK